MAEKTPPVRSMAPVETGRDTDDIDPDTDRLERIT
jgi:hypothetical protein